MANILNVGMIQNSGDVFYQDSIQRISRETDKLMDNMNTPDIVVGTEMGIGMKWAPETKLGDISPPTDEVHDTIPGAVTDALSRIAQKHKIYFMPGSMVEKAVENGKTYFYNTIPIFGPDGEIIDKYRKMCPYYPLESNSTKGERYVVFEIPEKNVKIGVMNCHDWCFPEISRNLTLMGAEVLLRPAVDPEGLYDLCKSIAPTRAVENQAYYISLNMAGEFLGNYSYGHSMVAGPDGRIIYEAGTDEISLSLALNIDVVKDARKYGTNYTEQLLRQLKYFDLPMPYANDIKSAPIYDDLPDPDLNPESRLHKFISDGLIKGNTK